jgi:NADH:ubiquinone oxidoreductase subunit 6 (subunit J)
VAFFHSLTATSQVFLSEGQASFDKFQSLYGLVRTVGGSEFLGWSLHLPFAVAIAVAVCVLWRSDAPFDMKAAALGVGAVLATPYAYLYDLVILAVPVAFLVRAILSDGPRTGEMAGLAAVAALLFGYPFVQAPVGLVAAVIVAVLIARRSLDSSRLPVPA